jgi:NAD(P)H-hydrate epimerase
MKLVTAAQMQALDRRTIAEAGIPGSTLMERAGLGVVTAMERRVGPLAGKRVAIFCGKGNNGGDGFVVARHLHKRRSRVQVYTLAKATELSGEARAMYRRLVAVAGRSAVHPCPSGEPLDAVVRDSEIVVDALVGTGLSAPVTGPYRLTIEAINRATGTVVAVDLPSGLHADTGAILGAAVRATLTVTFGQPKVGLCVGNGIDQAGAVEIVDIGIPPAYVEAVESHIALLTHDTVRRLLPIRPSSSHKGTFGHAGIIAGSVGKTGAAALAAKAALRVGAGLVTVATPAGVNDALEAKLLESMTAPMPETKAKTLARSGLERLVAFSHDRTAVAIGPGLTTHPETVELIQALLPRLEKPVVLDADALNALAGRPTLLTGLKVTPIVTPHPGEMARLEEAMTPQSVNADRLGTAMGFARRRRVLLVLKGARTVIAHPDGQAVVCPTGNPGMATAGTGDVLTGMIVGFLAQRLGWWEAACIATYCHGLAGDLAAADLGQAGMTAGDLLDRIPLALRRIGSSLA